MNENLPVWTQALELDDWQFLKRFLLASGSLKGLAEEYGISYPTVRSRLDRLIAKVQAADRNDTVDSFHSQLRVLVAEGRVDMNLAQKLLSAHLDVLKQQKTQNNEGGYQDET